MHFTRVFQNQRQSSTLFHPYRMFNFGIMTYSLNLFLKPAKFASVSNITLSSSEVNRQNAIVTFWNVVIGVFWGSGHRW